MLSIAYQRTTEESIIKIHVDIVVVSAPCAVYHAFRRAAEDEEKEERKTHTKYHKK